VLYRHEKRFENPPGIAILISDKMDDAEVSARLKRFKELSYVRVGLNLKPEMAALRYESGDSARFTALVTKVKDESDAGIILMAADDSVMAAALKICADRKPLIYAATSENAEKMAALAKEFSCPIAARADGLEGLAALTDKLTQLGVKDIVLDSGARELKQALQDQVMTRRLALNSKFRPLGFPTIILANEMTDNPMKEAMIAATFIAKYGGIIVLSDFQGDTLFPLLVLRMNLYSDPQRPLATTEGIYDIGGPNENSPVLITSNFSLTYFIVSGEIENSRIPSYLIVKDTEGLSVMTAWAAGKFAADNIATLVKKSGIENKVKHRKLIIPGYIASESGGLEEELPGWEILVGPREGAHIPAFLKSWTA
jgi:acetyl-CoA decarbonylase/synthase complex subunit gamma